MKCFNFEQITQTWRRCGDMQDPLRSQQPVLDTNTIDAQQAQVTLPPQAAAQATGNALHLWLYATGMLLVIGAFARRYPLTSNAHMLTDIGKLSGYQRPEFAGYVG